MENLRSAVPHSFCGLKQRIRIRNQWRLYGRSQHCQSKLLTSCSHPLRTSSNFIPLRRDLVPRHVRLAEVASRENRCVPCSPEMRSALSPSFCGLKQRIRIRDQWRLYGRSQLSQSTLKTSCSHQLRTSSNFIPLR